MVLLLRLLTLTFFLTGCIDFAVNESKLKQLKHPPVSSKYPPGEIYTMRGGFGGIFSKGMNRLQNTLENSYGIPTASTVWYKGNSLNKDFINRYQNNPSHPPIILIGHSLGANEQVHIARILNKKHIEVALLITVDPVIPATVSPNVRHAINFYKPSFVPLLSGLTLRAEDPKKTHLENIDVTTLHGVNVHHFNIDSHYIVQKRMRDEIIQTLRASRTKKGLHAKA